jgi:hypothetical protein
VVPRVFHQATARLDEALLHAGQRPVVDTLGEHEPSPEVAEVVGQHAQLESDFVAPKPVTRQSRPVRRLLAFLDLLLGGAALVVEAHDGTTRELEIRHDEPDALDIGGIELRLGQNVDEALRSLSSYEVRCFTNDSGSANCSVQQQNGDYWQLLGTLGAADPSELTVDECSEERWRKKEHRHGEVSEKCSGTELIQVDVRPGRSQALGFRALECRRSEKPLTTGSRV